MIVYLSEHPTIKMGSETTKKKPSKKRVPAAKRQKDEKTDPYNEYDISAWLPFDVNIKTDEKGESVEVIQKEWEWYFGNRFRWNKMISISSAMHYDVNNIAKNSYGGKISVQLDRRNGGVSLIPPDNSITYSEFFRNTLANIFGIDSDITGRSPPTWLSDYSLPKENDIRERITEKKKEIEELEDELQTLTKFKKLLYETSTNLEEITRDAFRELDFTVDSEVPGKRDGILNTSKTKFALEITGTTGGVKKSKARQLDDWVENVTAESPQENVSGLLVVNAYMSSPPHERDISVEPNVQSYMEQRGNYKVLITSDLYYILKLYLNGNIEKTDIKEIFHQEDTLLSIPDEFIK